MEIVVCSERRFAKSDSLVDMTVFARVIDVGSLSVASREMNISLALVSKRLARLKKARRPPRQPNDPSSGNNR
jgi:hypothetical protein